MKAYALDLRKRIIDFVKEGGTKSGAAERFKVSRSTVYRCIYADNNGTLGQKPTYASLRKLDPEKLREEVTNNPNATLAEYAEKFNVNLVTIWYSLKKMGIKLKRTHKRKRGKKSAKKAK